MRRTLLTLGALLAALLAAPATAAAQRSSGADAIGPVHDARDAGPTWRGRRVAAASPSGPVGPAAAPFGSGAQPAREKLEVAPVLAAVGGAVGLGVGVLAGFAGGTADGDSA